MFWESLGYFLFFHLVTLKGKQILKEEVTSKMFCGIGPKTYEGTKFIYLSFSEVFRALEKERKKDREGGEEVKPGVTSLGALALAVYRIQHSLSKNNNSDSSGKKLKMEMLNSFRRGWGCEVVGLELW